MKKRKMLISIIVITMVVLLVGCSSGKKNIDNGEKLNVNDTTNAEETTYTKNSKDTDDTINDNQSSSNNEKTSNNDENSLQKDKASKAEDTNNNVDSKLLESIDNSKSIFDKGYSDYTGTIAGNIPIRMSIYQSDEGIIGTYYYEKNSGEMNLKGKADDKNIVLYEYDETGKNTGVFKGNMSTVDKIEGTWTSADNKKSYPFSLSLEDILPRVEYGKRYAVAVNNKSDEEVEKFTSEIQSYIINDNKEKLAEVMAYPINVKVNGQVTKIQNKDELIKNYNQIFNSDYKKRISNAPVKNLFVNYKGIMIDNGRLWINDIMSDDGKFELKISAIGN